MAESVPCYWCRAAAPAPKPLEPPRCERDDCPRLGGGEREPPPALAWGGPWRVVGR